MSGLRKSMRAIHAESRSGNSRIRYKTQSVGDGASQHKFARRQRSDRQDPREGFVRQNTHSDTFDPNTRGLRGGFERTPVDRSEPLSIVGNEPNSDVLKLFLLQIGYV